jgi:S1-C subfamily serine protease
VAAVERAMPCVVNIATEEVMPVQDPLDNLFRQFFDPYYRRRPPNTQYSLGSGVIIDEEGFVLTNFHVVSRARRVWVKLHDGREYEAERIVGTSFADVALLRIRGKENEKFKAIQFAADDDLLLGETVLALGNPFGLGGSVSRGILSSKSRRPPAENEPLDVLDWLQTDAAINPGNSGGPLIDLRGELVGINVAIYREGQGIGFAIPVKRVAAAVSDMYSPEWLERMWFGARLRPGAMPLPVMTVETNSPAAQAGLRAGDCILRIDGIAPSGFIQFTRELLQRKERDIPLEVQRGDERRTLRLRLVPEKTFFNAELIRKKTGLTLQEMTRDLARGFGLSQVEGLIVAEVEKKSPAAAVELRPGILVRRIDGQQTDDLVTAAKTLSAKTKGDQVKLEVIVPIQRGPFLQLPQMVVEIIVR